MVRTVKKPEIRKGEIIAAARHLFLTKEYDVVTMQNIMESVGIAKGTIYHYFKSKEELLEAVVEDIINEDYVRKELLLKDLKGTALEKIHALTQMDSLAVRYDALLDQLHQPGNAGLHARLLAVALIKESKLYGELIRQGCKEKVFYTDFPHESAEFLLTAVQFLTDRGIYPWTNEDLERRARAFPAMIEALLKAPQGSFNFLLKRLG